MSTVPARRARSAKPPTYEGNCYSKIGVRQPSEFGRKTIFRCNVCGWDRQWGAHVSPETKIAWLRCEGACGTTTKHSFVEVE